MNLTSILFVDGAPVFGGAQRSLLSLIAELDARKLASVLLTGSTEFYDMAVEAGLNARLMGASVWTKSLSGALTAAKECLNVRGVLKELLEQKPIDLAYANGIQAGLLLSAGLPKAMPMVFHHRDVRCPKAALKHVAGRADLTIVLSEFMAGECRDQLGGTTQFECVYNGFDVAQLTAAAATSADVPEVTGPVVALVADLVPWKRHDLFLEGVAIAMQDVPDLNAWVIGGARESGGETLLNDLKQMVVRLGIERQITFVGHVPNALPWMQKADLVCSIAPDEPFGRTVVEALALGTPVAVSDRGGTKEIVNGVVNAVTTAADKDSVAEAILKGLTLERNAPDKSWQKRFAIQNHADRILELITKL